MRYFSGMVVQTVVEGTGASPLPTDTVKASALVVPHRTVPSWVTFVLGPSRLIDWPACTLSNRRGIFPCILESIGDVLAWCHVCAGVFMS